MKMQAKVAGSEAMASAFARLGAAEGLAKVVEASAAEVREEAVAKLGSDKRSAELGGSLQVVPVGDGLTFSVSTPLIDGWHRENGTLNDGAQPWLAPALDAARPAIDARLRVWLVNSTKRTSGR